MDVLAKRGVVVGGRTYEVQVMATAHHINAQALEGLTILLELRVSWPACRDRVLLGHLHGDRALIADELVRAVRSFLIDGSVEQGTLAT